MHFYRKQLSGPILNTGGGKIGRKYHATTSPWDWILPDDRHVSHVRSVGAAIGSVDLAQEHHAIWNGVTVSPDGRVFVNYPALSPRPILAVGEIEVDGTVRPYPGGEWNEWSPGKPVDHTPEIFPRAGFAGRGEDR